MFRKAIALFLVLCTLLSCAPALAAGDFDFALVDKPEVQVNPQKTTKKTLFEKGYARIEGGSLVFTTAGMKDELGSFAGQSVVWVSARAARDTQEQDVLTIHFVVDGEIETGYLRAKRVTPLTADEAAGYERLAADGLAYNGKKLMPVRFNYTVSEDADALKPQDLAVAETIVVQTPTNGKPIPENAPTTVGDNKDELDKQFMAVSRSAVSGEWHNLSWSFDGSTLSITGSGDMYEAYYTNYPWREYNQQVTQIKIGNYVTSVGYDAFYGFSNLMSVTLGSRITRIGNEAFEECKNLMTLTIPASLTTIEYDAFRNCQNLMNINFAGTSKLDTIGNNAFYSCKNLLSVELPNSVTHIGEYAFAYCSNLMNLKFGSKMKTIGYAAFYDCDMLRAVDFPASVRTIDRYSFYDCDALTSVTIAYGVQTIGWRAFEGCNKLTGSVKIPATVTSWGYNSFDSTALTEALIYSNCAIPDEAFDNCTSLKNVTIGGTVTGVGQYAFRGCTSLPSVTVPASVTYIKYAAFQSCTNLTKATLSSGLTSIGAYAFAYTGLTSVKLPNSVTSMDHHAFYECYSLQTADLGNGLTSIAYDTFWKCSALTTVKLGNNINSIGGSAFRDCVSLTTINWPTNLNTIDNYSFSGCDSLVSVSLPAQVNSIGYQAFGYCDNLQSVTTGQNVTSFGNYAFAQCPALQIFKTFSTGASYSSYTFYGANSVTMYGFAGSTAETFANNHDIPFVPITDLDKPVSHKIANTVQGVHVYWQYVPGATYYTLWRSATKTGGYSKVADFIGPLHYTDTNVTSGKTYYYKVVAHNAQASSPASDATSMTYVETPDITSRFNKAAGIVLGWNKVTGATGYAVYRKSYAGNEAWTRMATITSGSTLTWTDTSVKNNNGTVYRYTVRALTGSSRSILSGCRANGRTMVRLCSQTLTSAAKASSTSIKASWTTSSQVTGYEVRFMVGSSVYKTVTIGNYKTGTKTFTGLPSGKTYKVQVRTYKKVDGVGSFYSAWSTEKYVTLP